MPEKKDFLSQFSTENKPDSFKEEERVKVVKERKPFNPLFVIIPVVVLIIAGLLIYLFLFRPNIEVVDFTGQSKNDATAWLKQQEIETTGIIFKEEYNFDVDKDDIISQTPETGKVTKKAKITYVVSKGADPNETVKVPDFADMSKDEISNWIKNNKLANTKLNTTYDDVVEKDQFIKAEYSGCDSDTFTRGCSLKISISKGKKPEDEIIMVNYVGKTYGELETWATSKKLKVEKYEAYSDYYDVGVVTYQSVAANEKVKAGDTIKATVSKGKAIKMVDMSNWKKDDVINWFADNGLATRYDFDEEYSNYGVGRVIDYDTAAGTVLNDVKRVGFVISLGNKVSGIAVNVGDKLSELKDIVNSYNNKGASIRLNVNENKMYSTTYSKDEIVSIECIDASGNILDLNGILPLNAIVNVSVSAGLEQSLDVSTFAGQEEGIIYFETQKLVDYLASKSLSFVNNTQTTYCLLKINDIQVDNTFYLNNINYKEGWKIEISEYPATLE